MAQYTVKDNASGKTITFAWEGEQPPTSDDMADVFKAAGVMPTSKYEGDKSGRKVSDMEAEFIAKTQAKTPMEKLKVNVADAGRAAMPYVRPVLEGGGATLGGIMGTAGGAAAGLGVGSIPGGVAGGVAGASLGYAGGAKLSDLIETGLDANSRPQPQSVTGQLTQSLSDLGAGAMYDMGGQAAGKAIGEGVKAAGKYISKSPLVDLAKERAKRVFTANADLTAQEAANAAKGTDLTNRLGVKLTPAQMTGKPALQSMEQGLATADPEFAATLNAQDAAAKQAALDRIQQATGKGKPLPVTQDLQTTGANTVDTINSALEPVKAAEREAWSKVPNYPLPSHNFDEAAATLRKTPMDKDTETAVYNILDFAERMPKTTEGMQSIERTINGKMFAPNADPNVKRVLGQLKQSLSDDFATMGAAADAGDIALHNGKVVYPSKIQEEIAALEQSLKSAQGQGATLPEQNKHLFEYLAGKGETVMQNNGITPAQYQKSLQDRLTYLQNKGQALDYKPPVNGANQQVIDNLQAGIDAKKAVLTDLQPAEDVATAYRAAKDISKERFDQFGGNVEKVLKPGGKIADENINRQFYTPSQTAQLIKAVGKPAAKEQMKPFVMADMLKTAAPDGVNFNVQSGINYIQKNRAQLEQLGLVKEAQQVLKDQIPNELERILAKRAPDVNGSQFFTSQDMRGILQKYGNTIKQLYGINAVQSLRDYNQLMGMIERKNMVSRGGNSNTADKLQNLSNMMIEEAKGPAKQISDGLIKAIAGGAVGGGGIGAIGGHITTSGVAIGATLNAARQAIKNGQGIIAQTYVKILKDATLNPQLAKDLMNLQRTGKIPDTLQTIIDNHLITGTIATSSNASNPQ